VSGYAALLFTGVFSIFSEANKYLVEVLTSSDEGDRTENIERLIEAIQKQPC